MASLPNFIVIGAMKAGTGALYEYLRRHPQVFMSVPKELNFFVKEKEWDRGVEWYRSHFADNDGQLAVGEATPAYSMDPIYTGVPERMHQVVPHARLVYLVRHPVDRIESHYQHELRKDRERRPPDRAVLEDPRYLFPSQYATQIDRYLEWFPRDRLKVVVSEELRDRRQATLRLLFEFLGVSRDVIPEGTEQEFSRSTDHRVTRPVFRRLRRSSVASRIVRRAPRALRHVGGRLSTQAGDAPPNRLAPSTRSELAARLAPEVIRLRELIGPPFDGWQIA